MEEQGSPILGCIGIAAIALWLGSCVFGGSNEPSAPTPPKSEDSAAYEVAPVPPSPQPKSTTQKATAKSGPIKLSDLDQADQAIRLAINVSGHLCAKPIQVVEAGTNLYGVQCITNRDGTGISNYLVNSRTNEVTAI